MTQMRQKSQPGPRGPGPGMVPQSCLLKTRSQALSPKPTVPGHGSSMVMEKTRSPQLPALLRWESVPHPRAWALDHQPCRCRGMWRQADVAAWGLIRVEACHQSVPQDD